MVGAVNVGSTESVTHYLTALTAVWERENNVYIISSDTMLNNVSQVSTGNADFGSPNWPGFNFVWINSPPSGTSWGLSLYKVTNSKNSSVYFYLDTRDRKFADTTTQDFWIYYDHNTTQYKYKYDFYEEGALSIPNGSILHVSDVHSWPRDVNNLEDFWDNSAAAVRSSGNHPLVIWGKYPDFTETGYKIYNKINTGSYSLLATVSASTFVYEHTSFDVVTSGMNSQYKIMAYKTGEESEYSNVASIQVDYPSKQWQPGQDLTLDFKLAGNYPNPFNPSTILSFNLPMEGLVRINIFNSLGEQVLPEINRLFNSGSNEILIDFSGQTTGVYYYQMTFNSQILSGKLSFTK